MSSLKQELTNLIDAFAVARTTNHQTLINQSATALVEFLESVEITEVTRHGNEKQDGGDADGAQVEPS